MKGQALRLVQFVTPSGKRAVGVPSPDRESLTQLNRTESVYQLAQAALRRGTSLVDEARARLGARCESYERAAAEQRLLPPLDHPDPMHCFVAGTGITHRRRGHPEDCKPKNVRARPVNASKSDAERLYELGVEGGRPRRGEVGALPEWFYKGNGFCVTGSERTLEVPAFSLGCGEEAEIAALYIVDADGTPRRLGYALGNDFSDHMLEQQNGIYLGHSKLRPCSLGPELLTGALPASVEGTSRILRKGEVLWEKPVRGGEANMTHSLANLEHHHFKYAMFRQPGAVHVHYLGAMALSFADNIHPQAGDIFEIAVPAFGRPLRNPVANAPAARSTIRPI